jgi:hypothetical protein
MSVRVTDGATKTRRNRREPCPPCPELPRNLTGNLPERTIMARVQRGKRRYQNNFSLRQHGTWEAAAEAAKQWLDELLARLPLVVPGESVIGRRNRSGVVGVHYHASRHRLRSGRIAEYPTYVARWPGAYVGVSWMFSTHQGEENAFLHACLCRELASADRTAVARAVRELSQERRAALLALRCPIPTSRPEAESQNSTLDEAAA